MSRKSGPALRAYLAFVFVVISAAFTIELYFGNYVVGARIGPDGPLVWQPTVDGCRHCAGQWVEISWVRYLFEKSRFFIALPVGAAFIGLAYWHHWELRHGRN